MSESVLIAIITALSVVLVAIITGVLAPLLLSIRKHAKTAATQATQANYQVTNDHPENLRVESDTRHLENQDAIADLKQAISNLDDTVITGQRASARRFAKLERRLGDVEQTTSKE